ncbi:MAG: hypothetical protein WCC35_14600, partial [Bradyrhizobium sp.]
GLTGFAIAMYGVPLSRSIAYEKTALCRSRSNRGSASCEFFAKGRHTRNVGETLYRIDHLCKV